MEYYKELAKIYDELINEDVDYSKWAEIIMNICEEMNLKRNSYLDLACGTGNLTYELFKNFKVTYGVDLSQDMLTLARDKMSYGGYKPKFICQDITSLSLDKKFDLITCCLDGVNYILEEENLKNFFKGINSYLDDNGLFIFDINSYYKLSTILGNNLFSFDNEEVVYTWENVFEDDIVDMYLTFFIKEYDERYVRFDEQHRERAYSEEFLEKIIENSGLKIHKKLNSYTEAEIDETCERIVYVIGK
ncbi:class I SAM-dependent DNA methyltransferase [Clostridium cellulovorans]|uniref:Methyltransferase type 11 n=1 Tax=Clostridium cellulovorans (strain ATCC 35296 / DSM 3052 / OCM 3 / 743B) TaxID=573061 RepID=D9SLZ7_CLOC7|nr:class I SAM-dependent methyltransferase [Clostridium cellulovorans]ADL51728.1 Methyltransferase type 11 [Clostridium cellulovorans 743B]